MKLAAGLFVGLAIFLSGGVRGAEPARVHSVTDLSHEFSFYTDGRFFKQYLAGGGNRDNRNWGTLHKCDLTNANLLVLMSGATPCAYVPEDIRAVREFMEAGGGVVVLGSYGTFRKEEVYRLNELAAAFGATFTSARARKPLTATPELGAEEVETYGGKTIELVSPGDWTVLVEDAGGRAVLARRAVGKGHLLVGARSLFGHRPDAKDPINAEWVRPLLHELVRNKPVDPRKPFQCGGYDNKVQRGSLELQYSDYLKPAADAILAIYGRCMPAMEKMLGVPPTKGMMNGLLLLATGGGGFSSGRNIGLGVFWGGFPEKEYGMIELIGHEGTHSWVLPFGEPMWNEPIATYVGALLGQQFGYEEEGRRAIQERIDGGRRHDPDWTKYDTAFGKDVPNAVHWGKAMWFWEEMRREKPDILARYFRAKRRLADPKKIRKYTPNECVAVLSHAMGRDMFPWFRKHGLTVSADKSAIPLP